MTVAFELVEQETRIDTGGKETETVIALERVRSITYQRTRRTQETVSVPIEILNEIFRRLEATEDRIASLEAELQQVTLRSPAKIKPSQVPERALPFGGVAMEIGRAINELAACKDG